MLADEAMMETMEPLHHEVAERELEMEEAKIDERKVEELRVAREEEEMRRSIDDSAVEYQPEFWCRHFYMLVSYVRLPHNSLDNQSMT